MKSTIKCAHCNEAIPRRNIVKLQLSTKITCPKCGGKNKIPHLWLIVVLSFIWFALIAVIANYVGNLLAHNEGGVIYSSPYSSISRLAIFVTGYMVFLNGYIYFIKRVSPLIKVA